MVPLHLSRDFGQLKSVVTLEAELQSGMSAVFALSDGHKPLKSRGQVLWFGSEMFPVGSECLVPIW